MRRVQRFRRRKGASMRPPKSPLVARQPDCRLLHAACSTLLFAASAASRSRRAAAIRCRRSPSVGGRTGLVAAIDFVADFRPRIALVRRVVEFLSAPIPVVSVH